MKSRIKSEPLTRDDVERLLGEIATLVNAQRHVMTRLDALIINAKKTVQEDLKKLAAQLKEKNNLVRNWACDNREEFGKLKSLQFANGKIGFRIGNHALELLNRKWNWKKALEAVTERLPSFIRQAPEIDKVAIINQREELAEFLPDCGLKVVQEETFYIEPDLSKAQTRLTSEAA